MTAKTVRLSVLENQNEHFQREPKNTLLIPEDTKVLITAGNTTIYDFDLENKKIMDYEANTTTRKIKETIHSLSNNHPV